jgi:dTDP-4-amino-4,6-dideoxygalactose transaminase
VFVDIDPKTFSFDLESLQQKSKEIAALVIIHTFGFLGDIVTVKKILGDKPIIEDCAHALGSTDMKHQVGSHSVAKIFSFNCHKPISVGGGGLLIVNEDQYIPRVRNLLQHTTSPKRWPVLTHLLKQILKVMLYRHPWYGLAVTGRLLNLRRDGLLQTQVMIKPMSKFNQCLLRRRIRSMESRWVIQRACAGEILEILGKNVEPVCRYIEAGDSWNGYLFPILLATHGQREASLNYFHKNKVDAFVLWAECLRTVRQFGYQPGECPHLEDVLERLLILPCYAELTNYQRRCLRNAIRIWHEKFIGAP